MLRIFDKLKETMEGTANKIQENMRIEIIKLQTKMSELKNFTGKTKTD